MHNSNLKNYKKIHSGKVRDIYEIDNNTLLIVTTDRISVFDKVLPNIIPEKGIILNEISNFWFKRYKNLIPNHIIDYDINSLEISKDEIKEITQRSITVKKLKTFPIEAIVRFYLSGSGYNEYLKDGYVCGIKLPKGLRQSEKLPEPIFTPSTKANVGDHDLNITHDTCINIIGKNNFEFIKKISIEIFNDAFLYLKERGIILSDTKFEFGFDSKDNIFLIDEVLTPDSSRFWLEKDYKIDCSPQSLDKQYIRDYVKFSGWTDDQDLPSLPDDIIRNTTEKYKYIRKIIQND